VNGIVGIAVVVELAEAVPPILDEDVAKNMSFL
jgi:hypothetical protein